MKKRNLRVLRRFFSFSATSAWGSSYEKEKFQDSKKILLPSGRSRLEPELGKGEISGFQEYSLEK